ncbi:MFS transporter [Streptomyces mirabilis]|uniref:MFS transporter n=1 Tax=Streptomyces mirabilis TaxID=68239 RepID=UPI0021C06606|nr:MFS transporter [Streptomyces mirabilis]MCT9112917.1 MFS transporter [Streptomyces mirabilis]
MGVVSANRQRTRVSRGPLGDPTYRMLWAAQSGSAVGGWMQSVGAQWMLVHRPGAATWVSLVQAASLLPVMFVSLPAGVLADVMDRRRLLIGVQSAMTVLAALLTVLTAAGRTTPAVLIAFTFLLGCGQAVGNPAWQAIQPELVPREQIPAAAALGSLSVNVARAVGPALAGLLLTVTSTWVLFAINAVSFTAVILALLRWRRTEEEHTAPEAVLAALHAGGRYVRHAPGVRRILWRAALFVVPASALWALLPVIASEHLHQGSGGYGLLLAALGAGAVGAALGMGRLRKALTANQLLLFSGLLYGGGALVTALSASLPVVAAVAVVTGAGWLVTLSTLNTSMQLTLPAWVRARALAAYLIVLLGGQGLGSLLWGLVARPLGTQGTLVLAASLLVVGAASLPLFPLLPGTGMLDRTVSAHWPEPALVFEAVGDTGPVLVEIAYEVAPEDLPEFLEATQRLSRSRLRTGATRWRVYQDTSDPAKLYEVFEVPTWDEHLRQHHERTTGFDQQVLDRVRALSRTEPRSRHLLPARSAAARG